MRHQLVLQFRGNSLADLERIVTLEVDLIEELGDTADVDGHDSGSGETNLFILTSDPIDSFKRIRPVLERRKLIQTVAVAHRQLDGDQYTVIWPEGSRAEFKIV